GRRQGQRHLLLRHRQRVRARPAGRRGGREGRCRGPPAQGAGARAEGGHRRQPGLERPRPAHRVRPGGHGRRRRLGRRGRLRHADPLRQRRRAAQAVLRHARPAVERRRARRQGLHRVRLHRHRPRRAGVDPAGDVQQLLPLRRDHRAARLHRPEQVRGRQPVRRLAHLAERCEPAPGAGPDGGGLQRHPRRPDRRAAAARRAV
ncbi:MAG: NAD(P)H dehydrogenase (quinone), Type IV, partial [uncultured Frankineae bacterium]